VPGVVAFHPDAAEVAKDEYCGAWATVLVLKISMLLSVLYLFLNLATVVQWLCDMMIESKSFSNAVMVGARKADKDGTGLPIVEMLAKAFLLRGGDESLISRLAVVQHHKKLLKSKQANLESKLSSLTRDIECSAKEEAKLTEKAKDGGDLAAVCHKLNSSSVDFDSWTNRVHKQSKRLSYEQLKLVQRALMPWRSSTRRSTRSSRKLRTPIQSRQLRLLLVKLRKQYKQR